MKVIVPLLVATFVLVTLFAVNLLLEMLQLLRYTF